jgi:hypothetical protein
MSKKSKIVTLMFVIVILSQCWTIQVQSQQQTLAETINNVVRNIQKWYSPWTVLYGQVFSQTNQSSFDNAVLQALSHSDYLDVIFIARLAEINGYSSTVISNSVITALQNISKAGSLPLTYPASNSSGFNVPNSFLVYDRYMIKAYRYAQELGVSRWNITQAFLDFASMYLQQGIMLWVNPQVDFSKSLNRYYDEYAETLDMFLEFAENGVNTTMLYNNQLLNATAFADDVWLNTQNTWNDTISIYGYGPTLEDECEMGNFAQIISEYQNYRGNLTYFNDVITDLQNKLLVNGWDSDGWAVTGVLKHADENSQERMGETTGALIALQMLYPYFSSDMQSNFVIMLNNA